MQNHQYVITTHRKSTLLYVRGPYLTKEAAKHALIEETRFEGNYPGDHFEVTHNTGWVFRSKELLKRLDIERLMPV